MSRNIFSALDFFAKAKRAELLLAAFAIAGFLTAATAYGQSAKPMPRIGWLSASASSSEFPEKQALDALREMGWIDGKTIIIEQRYAAGDADRLSQFAADLVQSKVDLIVTFSAGVAIAKRATGTIPIVVATSQDPVRAGFVASMAHPGGNLTGVTFLNDDLSGKRLELLKETLPAASRAAIVWEPSHVDNEFKGMQGAASALGVRIHSVEVPRPARPGEVERSVQSARDSHAEAVILAPSGFTISNRRHIIELALKNRMPVFSAWKIFAEEGAILTYGPEIFQISRRVAYFVDRVLKGAKPTELPVEQPAKFEFVANLKAAKQIGLTIPPNVLARADQVIK